MAYNEEGRSNKSLNPANFYGKNVKAQIDNSVTKMDHIKPFIYRFNHDSWSYSPVPRYTKESGRNFLTIPTP